MDPLVAGAVASDVDNDGSANPINLRLRGTVLPLNGDDHAMMATENDVSVNYLSAQG